MWTFHANEWLMDIAISENGEYILAGHADDIYLFTPEDNVPCWSYPVGWVYSVAISRGGEYLAAGTSEGVYLFVRENNTPRWFYSVPNVYSVAISDNGDYIVAGTSGGAYLFKRRDNVPEWSFAHETMYVAISGNGNYIVATTDPNLLWTWSKNIYLFSSDDNKPIWSSSPRVSIPPEISSDGRYLVFDELGRRLSVYDRIENALIVDSMKSDNLFGEGHIGAIAMSSDGRYIAFGVDSFGPRKESGFVTLFSVPENRILWVY
jgi:outer membrane protein assembly factor BamB